MQPHKLIIGILMFSLFITGGIFVMFGDPAQPNDGIFDNYTDISTRANEFDRDKFVSMDSTRGGQITPEAGYNISKLQEDDLNEDIDQTTQWRIIDVGPVKVIRRMKQYYNLLNGVIEETAKILHIPEIFIDFAVVAFSIIIIFMVAYFIMRFQPRDN